MKTSTYGPAGHNHILETDLRSGPSFTHAQVYLLQPLKVALLTTVKLFRKVPYMHNTFHVEVNEIVARTKTEVSKI